MAEQMGSTASPQTSRANLAFGVGIASLVVWVAAIAMVGDSEEGGWMWILAAGLGLAAAVTGWTARRGSSSGRAITGLVIGTLMVLVFLGFVIFES